MSSIDRPSKARLRVLGEAIIDRITRTRGGLGLDRALLAEDEAVVADWMVERRVIARFDVGGRALLRLIPREGNELN